MGARLQVTRCLQSREPPATATAPKPTPAAMVKDSSCFFLLLEKSPHKTSLVCGSDVDGGQLGAGFLFTSGTAAPVSAHGFPLSG